MNPRRPTGGRAAESAADPSAAAAGTGSPSRVRELFDRVVRRRPAWLKRLERPAQERPVPRIAFVSLTVGGLLLVIGALLPWSETMIPVIETINGEEVVTGVGSANSRGVSEGGTGGVTLGLGVVMVGIALLLWQQGLRDAVGLGLPFLAAIAVVVAGLKYDDISNTATDVQALKDALATAGDRTAQQLRFSVGTGLYVTLVGGIVASLGALRVSIATRKAGKADRAGEEKAGGARRRR